MSDTAPYGIDPELAELLLAAADLADTIAGRSSRTPSAAPHPWRYRR